MRALLGLLIAGCALYAVRIAGVFGDGTALFLDRWLVEAILAGGAISCLWRAATVRLDRGAWFSFGLAIAIYLVGNIYWDAKLADLDYPPFPSLADAGWLLFYLPAYVGIALLLRERAGHIRVGGWLDGMIGALAVGAAAAATVLAPVLRLADGDMASVATNLAYPILDLVLIVFAGSAILVVGRKGGNGWLSLLTGLILFAIADAAYLLATVDGTYVDGQVMALCWPLAACFIATAAWQPMAAAGARRDRTLTEQALIAGFAVIALGVLIVDLATPVGFAGKVLAVAAMSAIIVRLVIAAHESRQIERARHDQARTDELTGLANRRAFYSHLEDELLSLAASQESAALLLMDLDHFKELNDTLGHAAGDQLLQELAARLPIELPEGAFVARIGGDEFVVLLPAGTDAESAHRSAAAVRAALARPMEISGIVCHAAASVGIAMTPDHGTDRSTLLRRADIAMYSAKRNLTGIEQFDNEHEQLSRSQIALVGELRDGLRRNELRVHYQPQVSMTDKTVTCVEALVRWEHPQRGLLAPHEFLPLCERYGLMRQITQSVLAIALEHQASWSAAGIELQIAVNLADADLADAQFPAGVIALLERFEVPASRLKFEITEDTVMVDPERVLQTLEELGALGITFALDDFGTGHSSLAHLKRLPIAELKIDQSFIAKMTVDEDDAVIVKSTIDLGHNLGLSVVAEGVSTCEHWDALAAQGCDIAQGLALSAPVPADDLLARLAAAGNEQAAA